MASYTRITVEKLTGALGAVIGGVDLAQPLDDATFAEIHRAWLEHMVIFCHGQGMDPAAMERLGARFGQLTVTSYVNAIEGCKFAHRLVREAEIAEGERNFGDSWHIDQTVREIPNAGFMLYSRQCPPTGGDTMFANLCLAYARLSPGMRRLCDSLVAVHSPAGLFGRDGMGGPGRKPFMLAGTDKVYRLTPEQVRAYMGQETEHPLVREHPETGRRLIYITGYVTRFRDMTEEESQPLLDWLRAHVVRPDFTCRFRWREGSLAIIDNRCLQHYAVQDYAGYRREMLRAEWADVERPYGPSMPRQAAAAA